MSSNRNLISRSKARISNRSQQCNGFAQHGQVETIRNISTYDEIGSNQCAMAYTIDRNTNADNLTDAHMNIWPLAKVSQGPWHNPSRDESHKMAPNAKRKSPAMVHSVP